jgi:putative cardiolipin synthase
MNRFSRLLAGLVVLAALFGCTQRHLPPPGSGDFAGPPAMPALDSVSEDSPTASVFGPPEEFSGSPLEAVGLQGLFDTHRAKRTQIALLKNGDASFAARVQLLEAARHSIRIQALIFSGDEAGLHIAETLKKKKAEGLEVRVIVDAPSNLGWQTQWMYFDLKQHGIEVQGYESLYLEWINEVPMPRMSPSKDPEAPNHRYHEKMWIVDGDTDRAAAVVGGLNIANEYFRVDPSDPDHFWRDQDVIVRGDIVSDMVTAFDRNFDHFVEIKESRGALNTDRYWQATRDFLDKFGRLSVSYTTRKKLVERVQRMADVDLNLIFAPARSRFFHNRPRLGEFYIQQAYRKLIGQAEREILICNAYFIPSAEFIGAVADAAGRGVRVIILTNSPETNDLPELTMVGRSYYKKILSINENPAAKENGGSVQIWEWYGWRYDQRQQTEGTIHAKYAVFDRRYALVGSYNLDPRSEKLNSETAIVFQSDNLSSDLARLFYGNDLAYSRRVTPADAEEFNDPSDALYKLRKEFGGLFESLL